MMTKITATNAIEKQLTYIHTHLHTDLTTEPILLQVSESLHAIGQPDRTNPNELYITLTTDAMEVVPQTKYDPDGWMDDITTDAPLFQFDNGYLVLTDSGFQFTPHMYKLGCYDAYTPNSRSTDIEVSLLLKTQSITMSTQHYRTLTFTPKEWDLLNKESFSDVVNELLQRGVNKQTYSTEETESETTTESILLIDGQEQNVWLEESARELLKQFDSDTE